MGLWSRRHRQRGDQAYAVPDLVASGDPSRGVQGAPAPDQSKKDEGPATCRAKASHGGGQPPAGLPLCAAKC